MANRDPVTGRFVSTRNTPASAEGEFETYTEIPVEIQGADRADLAYGTERRHAPAADDLAQGSQESLLRPRTAKLVSDRNRDTTEVYAKPDRSTLHREAMTEAGRELPEELRYLTGNIDGSVDQ